jgi:[protein-PII] uridylyltransferase
MEVLESNARFVELADRAPDDTSPLSTSVQEERGATLLTIYAKDEPGIFYRIAAAISLAGGNIIDARIHTSSDGMALDNFLVQDADGTPFDDPRRLERLEKAVLGALNGHEPMMDRLEAKALPLPRAEAFHIKPAVLIDNRASNRYTVVEVNARDRPALLSGLAEALFQSRAMVHSAHIATYGERAVDVFYLTDRNGEKIESATRLKTLQTRLLKAAGAGAKLQLA